MDVPVNWHGELQDGQGSLLHHDLFHCCSMFSSFLAELLAKKKPRIMIL